MAAKFPSEQELEKMRAILNHGPASRSLHPRATLVERLKYSLCEQFVIYLLDNKLTQRELAEKVGIDESLMSKIVRYNFDDFTMDRLVKYLTVLFPGTEFEISVKKRKNTA